MNNKGFLLIEQLIILTVLSLLLGIYFTGIKNIQKYTTGKSIGWNIYFFIQYTRFLAIAHDLDTLFYLKDNHLIHSQHESDSTYISIPSSVDIIINRDGRLGFKGSGNTKKSGHLNINIGSTVINKIKLGIWDGPVIRQ